MLGIVLFILKILLWIVLGVLGLLLGLLLMVLLVPIRYSVEGSKYETMKGQGKVSYLFHIFSIFLNIDEGKISYKLKILFFTVYKGTMDEEEEDVETSDEEEEKQPSKEILESQKSKASEEEKSKNLDEYKEDEHIEKKEVKCEAPAERTGRVIEYGEPKNKEVPESEEITEDEGERISDDTAPEVSDENAKEEEGSVVKRTTSKKKRRKKTELEDESTFDKIKRFYRFLKESKNEGLIKFVFKMVWKIIRSMLPKKVRGHIRFGLEDPSLTGFILGAVSTFYIKYKNAFTIEGEFQEPMIEGHIKAKGRIWIVEILVYCVRIILDGRVRRLIKEARS